MNQSNSATIEAASGRLRDALDALEAAVERRREFDRAAADLDAQLQALGSDRARLATELDAASARARRLEQANRDVAQRLDQAMDNVRAALGGAVE